MLDHRIDDMRYDGNSIYLNGWCMSPDRRKPASVSARIADADAPGGYRTLACCTEYHARPDLAPFLPEGDLDYGFGLNLPADIVSDLPRVEFVAEFAGDMKILSPGAAVTRFINKHVYAMPQAVDPDLCRSHMLSYVVFETTNLCQLNCTYCGPSLWRKQHKQYNMPIDSIRSLLAAFPNNFPGIIEPNLNSELTARSDWMEIIDICLEKSTHIKIVTNFSKKFSNEEIACLSNLHTIAISIDTADSEIHKKVRRGSNLETIYSNILRLKAYCLLHDKKCPELILLSVLTDASIDGFEELSSIAHILGFKKIFARGLVPYDYDASRDGNAIYPNQLSELSPKKCRQTYTMLQTLQKRLQDQGMDFRVHNTVWDQLQKQMPDKCAESKRLTPGMTRLCLDPWRGMYIWRTGESACCCHSWDREPLHLANEGKIDYNTNKLIELRKNLLTGYLPVYCFECPRAPITSIEELTDRVKEYISGNIIFAFTDQE